MNLFSELLQRLSPDERRAFGEWVRGRRAECVSLVAIHLTHLQNKRTMPSREGLYAEVFGKDAAFKEQELRRLYSRTLALLEAFLVERRAADASSPDFYLHLREEYIARRLPKHFRNATDSLGILSEKSPLTSGQQARDNWQRYRMTSLTQRTHDEELWQQSQHFGLLDFVSLRLWQACQWAENQRLANPQPPDDALAALLACTPEAVLTATEKCAVWLFAYRLCFERADFDTFLTFTDRLRNLHVGTDIQELRELYHLAINYCSRMYNSGRREYLLHQLDLFREGLDRGILLDGGYVPAYTFTNMMTLALVSRDYEQADAIISDYASRITVPQRDGVTAYNQARCHYARAEYHKALQQLQRANYHDLLLNLSAKTVQLKTYFMLSEVVALQSHLDAMRQFIRRHTELGYHRDNFSNLLNVVGRLLRLAPGDTAARLRLRTEVELLAPIAEKEWLLEVLA